MENMKVQEHKQDQCNETTSQRATFRLSPAVDIYETTSELVLNAELPGVEETGLSLEVSRGVLTLEGDIVVGEEERPRSFYRQFKLSERINGTAGDAVLKDGVLTLRLPKIEEEKPKKIAVKTLH